MEANLLTEVPAHEFPIGFAEQWNAIEDCPPEVEIISLMDNPVIFAEGELCAAIKGGAGPFLKGHHHFPLKENIA
jgi:hypothetical protein